MIWLLVLVLTFLALEVGVLAWPSLVTWWYRRKHRA